MTQFGNHNFDSVVYAASFLQNQPLKHQWRWFSIDFPGQFRVNFIWTTIAKNYRLVRLVRVRENLCNEMLQWFQPPVGTERFRHQLVARPTFMFGSHRSDQRRLRRPVSSDSSGSVQPWNCHEIVILSNTIKHGIVWNYMKLYEINQLWGCFLWLECLCPSILSWNVTSATHQVGMVHNHHEWCLTSCSIAMHA